MNHGSLFSGIGGFDLAAEWMGWENVMHCEINPFGRKILKYYWPKAKTHEDITKTDFTIYRGKIDILTGGFPCQPYSAAGKRLGKEDDRHLWPEMLRAIREIQPRWIVGENVRGLINWNGGMVFDEVHTDLETQGYKVLPVLLSACAVSAPHRRDRIWFVAYANSFGSNIRCTESKRKKENAAIGSGIFGKIDRSSAFSTAPNSCCQRLQRSKDKGSISEIGKKRKEQPPRLLQSSWKNFPTQPPVCRRNDGLSNQLDGITFSKWRKESIKAYGNAIVPQVVFQIFKAIQSYENNL